MSLLIRDALTAFLATRLQANRDKDPGRIALVFSDALHGNDQHPAIVLLKFLDAIELPEATVVEDLPTVLRSFQGFMTTFVAQPEHVQIVLAAVQEFVRWLYEERLIANDLSGLVSPEQPTGARLYALSKPGGRRDQ